MAGQTFRIVKNRAMFYLTMGIVARHATNTHVVRVEALTVGEPVRLESDIVNLVRPVHGNLRPCTVALTAEIRHLFGGQLTELPHSRTLGVPGFDSVGMLLRRSVAVLA